MNKLDPKYTLNLSKLFNEKNKIVYLKDIILQQKINPDQVLWLKLCDTGVEELYNINLFKNLKIINISGNKLIKVDSIPSCVEELSCEKNNLTCVDFINNNLIRLNCSDNNIKSICHDKLEILYCSNNQLNNFNCKSLKKVYCDNNNLVSINSSRTIEYINCSNNNIKVLPSLPNCSEIYANDNNLTKIDNEYNNIKVLHVFNNKSLNIVNYYPSMVSLCVDDINEIMVSEKYNVKNIYYESTYLGLTLISS